MAMTALECDALRACVATKPARVLFATACGPRLYGFPRQGPYVDLRSVHVAASDGAGSRSHEWREQRGEVQIEWVSHEVGKFVRLLQVNNGGAYEQLFSPYEVVVSEQLSELRTLALGMIGLPLAAHYQSQFTAQLARFRGQRDKHGRHMLYLYRVALTGLHLLERGQVLLDLKALARFHERVAVLELLDELDHQANVQAVSPYMRELEALARELAAGVNQARLPDQVPGREAAEAWLAGLRA